LLSSQQPAGGAGTPKTPANIDLPPPLDPNPSDQVALAPAKDVPDATKCSGACLQGSGAAQQGQRSTRRGPHRMQQGIEQVQGNRTHRPAAGNDRELAATACAWARGSSTFHHHRRPLSSWAPPTPSPGDPGPAGCARGIPCLGRGAGPSGASWPNSSRGAPSGCCARRPHTNPYPRPSAHRVNHQKRGAHSPFQKE
jgi:hypothetical protein